jgi:hypothetical protein
VLFKTLHILFYSACVSAASATPPTLWIFIYLPFHTKNRA